MKTQEQQNEQKSARKPLDYAKIFFKRKWLIIIPAVIGIMGGLIAANTLPKVYQSSTLMLVEEGRVINPLIQGLAVSTSVSQRLGVLREQLLGWDRLNQLITKLGLAKDIKSQSEFEGLVKRLRKDIQVKLYGHNIVSIAYEDQNAVKSMNVVKTITDIFIAENLRQQNAESENAINFINEELDLYKKKMKQSEVAAMEDHLNKLLLDSTEKHPMVIELRKKIASAKAEIEKGNYEINNPEATKTNEEIKKIREELKQINDDITATPLDSKDAGANRAKIASNTNDKIYKMLLLERMDNVTKDDANVNQKLYNTLLERLETAKITQRLEASKEGTKYTVLDPARLPLSPSKPNKVQVLLIGLFAGLCTGIGLVLGVDMLDQSFLGIDEAQAYLELPLLGAVSKIVTQADIKAQELRNKKIMGISTACGAALLVIIIFNILMGN